MVRPISFFRYITLVAIIFIFGLNLTSALGADSNKLLKVVIDAGHGGKDPGAIGKSSQEKNITLSIALQVGAYINKYLPEVEVIYTRKTDDFIELHERARIANDNDADLFISIHVNSSTNSRAYGTSSHVLGAAGANKNMEVAIRENTVIELEEDYSQNYEEFDPRSFESYVIFQFMQGIYQDQSIDIATRIQDQFSTRVSRKDRGVETNMFLVLHQTKMPSVLIETGFLSNPAEEKYLLSKQGQDYMSSAIYRAFRDYKSEIDKKSTITHSTNTKPTEQKPLKEVNNTPVTSTKPAAIEVKEKETITIAKEKPKATEDINASIPKEKQIVKSETKNTSVEKVQPASAEQDVVYKLQILSSLGEITDNSKYKDLPEFGYFQVGKLYKYTCGKSSNIKDIISLKHQLQTRFPDAFVIAFYKGEKIPLLEAKKLLKPTL